MLLVELHREPDGLLVVAADTTSAAVAAAARQVGGKLRAVRVLGEAAAETPDGAVLVFGRRPYGTEPVRAVIGAALEAVGVTFAEVYSRKAPAITARRAAWLVLRQFSDMSLPTIAAAGVPEPFDHTTVLHGLRRARELHGRDETFIRAYEAAKVAWFTRVTTQAEEDSPAACTSPNDPNETPMSSTPSATLSATA